jgi:hypothetical protein
MGKQITHSQTSRGSKKFTQRWRRYLGTVKTKTQCTKIYAHSEIRGTAQRQLYFSSPVFQKKNDLISPKRKSKHKASKRKEMIKSMAEINQIENKKAREK